MAAPEPLSPVGGAGEEGPEEDEDEAEAEDPERPVGAIGARSGSSGSGGGGGAGAGGSGGPGGALTRRAVTLRVLLKDAQLEPGAGVLSIYYLSPASEGEEEELLIEEEEEEVLAGVSADDKSRRLPAKGPTEPVNPVPGWRGIDAAHFPYLHPAETTSPGKRVENKIRVPVRYCMLGSRDSARNPHTLVEVTSFAAINKFQPFNVAISSNVLFLLDFHSHLTRSEVVGYLGGRWDINSQMLTVLRAFPCRSRLGHVDTAATMEEEPHLCPQIYQSLLLRGLSLVGWYHSHPHSPALPSLQDIDTQMDYQLRLQGSSNGFQPCLALLCSPYYSGNLGPESKISPFWVMPPPEQRPSDYGIPMDVEMAYVQDSFLTNDILHEMMLLVEFYKGAPDLVRFQEPWNQEHTYLDKLKISLASRMPKDQGLCHVLEQVYSVLKQGN
ncbi:MPN domain-containing protein isoform X8 [Saccopteryx bilineata]|uniref:MPN domain-containing protein isoform X8 n=1 Tax=Saccopteryx bilineata TaxID=59482 RepID=UPI00338F1A6D